MNHIEEILSQQGPQFENASTPEPSLMEMISRYYENFFALEEAQSLTSDYIAALTGETAAEIINSPAPQIQYRGQTATEPTVREFIVIYYSEFFDADEALPLVEKYISLTSG